MIAEGRKITDPDNARLAKRLRKQRKNLSTFLELEGVEATNNRAERALRPAVVVRKTGGDSRQPGERGPMWCWQASWQQRNNRAELQWSI